MLTVVVVALGTRLALAFGTSALTDVHLVPDEAQYIALADAVANDGGAESWWPGYGSTLYRSSFLFTGLLARAFEIFPVTRLVGASISVVFGVVTAALTVFLAREVVGRRWALGAGLVVALMPSQVYWSSASIRESMIWTSLALAGLLFALAVRHAGRASVIAILGAGTALLALGWLRDQTLVAGVWALVLASALGGRRGLVLRMGSAFAGLLVVPALAGVGAGGIDLVRDVAPRLGATRTFLSMDAQSAITPTTLVHDAPDDITHSSVTVLPGSGHETEEGFDENGNRISVIHRPDGELVAVEGVGANLRHLPRGLVASTLRPFPWDSGSHTLLLAKIENLVWLPLYVLAAIGVWTRRKRLAALAFPLVTCVTIVGIGALTQGNVGTAFRHRAQILWALSILAAAGAEWLWGRSGLNPRSTDPGGEAAATHP